MKQGPQNKVVTPLSTAGDNL